MPCSYSLNADETLIEMACWKRVTPKCILGDLDALETTPNRIATLDELRDYSGITEVELETETLRNIAQLMRGAYLRAGWRKRIAMFAPTEPGRVYSSHLQEALSELSGLQVKIFDTKQAALAFLRGGGDGDRRADLRQPV